MGDGFFSCQEANLKRLREIGRQNVYGETQLTLPCDDLGSWNGQESCDKCPKPCKIHEQPERGKPDE